MFKKALLGTRLGLLMRKAEGVPPRLRGRWRIGVAGRRAGRQRSQEAAGDERRLLHD